MADLDDDGEFAYFLPKGIEDDQDDGGFGGFDGHQNHSSSSSSSSSAHHIRENTNINAIHQSPPSSSPVDDTSGAYGTYQTRPLSINTNWQQQQSHQQHSNQAQQAALLSVLQRENARHLQQQQQQQQQIQYTNNNSTEALLAALYAQQNNNSSTYGNYPNISPSHAASSGNGFTGSSGNTSTSSSDGGYNTQQMQFFQQLQIYQQQLLMQQQQSSIGNVGVGGGSHYTKVTPQMSYDDARVGGETQPMGDSSAPRRRPLPHHSHTNVTIMNRPPSDERDVTPTVTVTQPKTTVVTAGSNGSSSSAVLSSSSWGAGHSSNTSSASGSSSGFDSTAQKSSTSSTYAKHVPVSVVASTKTETWPKVKTVKAGPTTASSTVTATITVEKEEKKPPVVTPSVHKVTTVTHSATSSKTSTPVKRSVPAATIRHIESEAPVPLTATEMAGLNAHLRKAASHLTPEKATEASSPTPVTSTTVTTVQSTEKDNKSSTVTVIKRPHRHEHSSNRFVIPGPKVLPNDNVFDFLGEEDPDAMPEEQEDRFSRGKGKGKQKHQGPQQSPEQSDEESTTKEEDENTNDSETPEDATGEEEEEVELEDSTTEETRDIEEDEPSETEVTSETDDAAPPRQSSPPISPTTGLPVAPILRKGPTSPVGSHARRVSFSQSQPEKEKIKKGVPAQEKSKPTTPATVEEEEPSTTAPAYPVESVTGLKKRAGKGKKPAGKIAQPPSASHQSQSHATQSKDDHDSDASADEPDESFEITKPGAAGGTTKSSGVAHSVKTFLGSFLAQHVAGRSRSVSARAINLASYMLGVLFGFLWTVICIVARIHREAATVISTDHQLAFCFTFLYLFPYLVHQMVWWAPPWAAPCLWYAFLMQVFCSTQGATWLVGMFRVLLPLLFLTEGVSHHTFLLELNGAERLTIAFVLSAFKTQEYYRPMFLLALSMQILTSLFYGNHMLTQWSLLIISLMVIHERDPTLPPVLAPASSPLKGKLASALSNLNADITTADPTTSTTSTQPPPTPGWMGSMFGGVGGAFNRRTRAKVNSKAARRTGRF